MVQVAVVITLDRETKIAEAKQAMLQVVFNHPVVVKSMQPLVLVKEIDNYWLTFEIRFWLQYQNFQHVRRCKARSWKRSATCIGR